MSGWDQDYDLREYGHLPPEEGPDFYDWVAKVVRGLFNSVERLWGRFRTLYGSKKGS